MTHVLSVLDRRRSLIVFFIVAEPGGFGVTFITPSLLLLFGTLFLIFGMFSFRHGLALPQAHRLTRYVIQSILSGIWFFRNKATFHNGRETSDAIVHFIRQDMIIRLSVDLYRLPLSEFKDLWCHPSFCHYDGNQVIPKF